MFMIQAEKPRGVIDLQDATVIDFNVRGDAENGFDINTPTRVWHVIADSSSVWTIPFNIKYSILILF